MKNLKGKTAILISNYGILNKGVSVTINSEKRESDGNGLEHITVAYSGGLYDVPVTHLNVRH